MFIGDCLSRKSSIIFIYLHDLFNKKTSQFETKGSITEFYNKVYVAKYTLNKCVRKAWAVKNGDKAMQH